MADHDSARPPRAGKPPLTTSQRLGRELLRQRVAANISQKELAERLGWSQSKLHRIERALDPFPTEQSQAIAEALELDPQFFGAP